MIVKEQKNQTIYQHHPGPKNMSIRWEIITIP